MPSSYTSFGKPPETMSLTFAPAASLVPGSGSVRISSPFFLPENSVTFSGTRPASAASCAASATGMPASGASVTAAALPPPPPPPPPSSSSPPFFFFLSLMVAMKRSIGLPSVTTSSAAGIWLEIFAFGSGGCGCSWPIVSFFSRSVFSASAWVWPTTLGTWTLPLPIAIRSATSESFLAFSPASGVWPMTVPGGASVLTFSFGAGASLRSASTSFCSASNVDFEPVTSGTVTLRGRNRNSSTASRISSGRSIMIHQGSHAFWRKTTWLGCSGMLGEGVPPPGTLS